VEGGGGKGVNRVLRKLPNIFLLWIGFFFLCLNSASLTFPLC
jgi:hypothetical protein